jgi:hypothetical protein
VAVEVYVEVLVDVGVEVAVAVLVGVGVDVIVLVLVGVGVGVEVFVNVEVLVFVGVGVDAETVCKDPFNNPPVTKAPCPVVKPDADSEPASNAFLKCLSVIPPTFRSNTNINVCGAPLPNVTNPPRFVNVTDPDPSNVLPPCTNASVPWYKPFDPAVWSWYSLTDPATVSFIQSMSVDASPVNTTSFTATGSIADAVNTTSIPVTFTWSYRYVRLAGRLFHANATLTVAVWVGVDVVVFVLVAVGVYVAVNVGVAVGV